MKETLLFSEPSLRSYLQALTDQIRSKIKNFSEQELLDSNFPLRISQLVTQNSLKLPVLDHGKTEFKEEEVERDVDTPFRNVPGRKIGKGKKFTFFVPFEGSAILFNYRPGQFTTNPPVGQIQGKELILEFTVSVSEGAIKAKAQCDEMVFDINRNLVNVESEVAEFNKAIPNLINGSVANRKAEIEKAKKEANDIGLKRRN